MLSMASLPGENVGKVCENFRAGENPRRSQRMSIRLEGLLQHLVVITSAILLDPLTNWSGNSLLIRDNQF